MNEGERLCFNFHVGLLSVLAGRREIELKLEKNICMLVKMCMASVVTRIPSLAPPKCDGVE